MKTNENTLDDTNKPGTLHRKHNVRQFIQEFKQLQGNPHYVALGMAIGVFVSVTPTIPFHTVAAIALAFLLKGSKPAAAIGVWFSNPITIPIFYWGSYKAGMFLLGESIPFNAKYESISELMKLGVDVTAAILGILPAVAAYFITRKIFIKIRSRKKKDVPSDHHD